ncbi:DEAD/DEAH box helicase [Thiolapillus brandeum]|uniref:SNF2 family protein n=1 Tax=Thiolapillus brandeum TaxID=1076588 RepID=A0A7U6GGS3_9GAMM|nr:DEAD/DEAH box helicase [Thiolapillus brandeum]BAO43336.1 SNF2 family protein [Thiolapillus brandeum]
MKTPSRTDIRHECGDTYYNRGASYQRHGAVLELNIKRETETEVFFNAGTKGSGFQPYQQEVLLSIHDKHCMVEGFCSCPVGYNCKHVVAACLEYIERKRHQPTGEVQLSQWLQNLENSARQTNPATQEEVGEFLAFVLTPGTRPLEFDVDFKISRRLKNGRLGKARTPRSYTLTSSYSKPGYIKPGDDEIIELIHISQGRAWNHYPLRAAAGGMALQRMVQSGRCFLGILDDAHRAQWSDEKRRLRLEWQPHPSGLLELKVGIEGGGQIALMDPVSFVDTSSGTVGRLETGNFNQAQIRQLLNAPLLGEAEARRLSRKLLLEHSGLALPPPVELDIKEIEDTLPRPRLTLRMGDTPYGSAHLAELQFDYDGHIIQPLPVGDQSTCDEQQQLIRIHRDLTTESAAVITLEQLGFQLLMLDDERLAGYLPADSLPESAAQWKTILDESLPELEARGWEIIVDASFMLTFHESEQWWGELDENDNGWFSMSLKVEIQGRRLHLLPLLGPVLEAYDPDDLPETLHIPLGDSQYLSVPGEKIRPWLETLIELFDSQPPREHLELSRFDAARLADMDEPGDLIWQGGEQLRELGRRLKDFKQIESVQMPRGFTGTLRDYQKTGYDWLHFLAEYGLGGILADDMGLGKTVQTLAFLANQKNSGKLDKPALIIAPTSLMSNWRREAGFFTPKMKVLVLQGPERHDRFALVNQHDLILTTYPLLPRDKERLLETSYSFLILDEAQVVKNPKAQAARIVRQIDAGQRLCLTGTPMENHLGELWAQFDFLMPGFLGDQSTFKRLYRTPIEKHGDQEKQARLSRRIAPFMLRRRKDEVEKDLPSKTEIIRSIPLKKSQAALYESIRLSMEKKVRDAIAAKGLARSHITILDALLKLRQTCCDPRLLKLKQAARVKESAKLDLLMELLPEMQDEGRRILLFSQFTSMLGLIQKALDQKKIRYSKLTGQTRKRDAAIERFVNGDADVFLISLKAGGVGLNLTAADTVIFYDPWWNPAAEAQAMDRAHRIGQDKPVFVYKLLTENTVEEKILALQKKKKALAEAVYQQGGRKENFQLDDKDLEVLFEPIA